MNHLQESRIIPCQPDVTIRTFQSGDEVAFHDLNESWILESFSMDDKDRRILGDPLGCVLKAGGEIFLIVRAEATLGCCALLPLEDQSWELAKMRSVARRCQWFTLCRFPNDRHLLSWSVIRVLGHLLPTDKEPWRVRKAGCQSSPLHIHVVRLL